jgi:hypothetical protein
VLSILRFLLLYLLKVCFLIGPTGWVLYIIVILFLSYGISKHSIVCIVIIIINIILIIIYYINNCGPLKLSFNFLLIINRNS